MSNNLSSTLIAIWNQAGVKDNELLQKAESLNEYADLIAINAALVSNAFAGLIHADNETGFFDDKSNISSLLLHLSDQFEMINALSFIGGEASHLLKLQKGDVSE